MCDDRDAIDDRLYTSLTRCRRATTARSLLYPIVSAREATDISGRAPRTLILHTWRALALYLPGERRRVCAVLRTRTGESVRDRATVDPEDARCEALVPGADLEDLAHVPEL